MVKSMELFAELPAGAKAADGKRTGKPQARVKQPNRGQMEFRASDLDSLLPEGHRARLVWAYVERLDLSAFYAPIKAVEGGVGRAGIAPEIHLALWLYATLEGVGSARALARLSQSHDAYRWICGGVQTNHHSLADFRVDHEAALDGLLTLSVANLLEAGAVKLKRVAQDGVRVRASAGAASFRRKARLEGFLDEAKAQVDQLKAQLESDPGAASRREQAARERVVRERQARVERALARLPEIEAAKRAQGKAAETARVSVTDAEATVMKMADGGFRPAYNGQFCTDTESQVIVGVAVTQSGSDAAQMAPMVAQVETRYGQAPAEILVDGGFPAHAQIEAVAGKSVVYAPVPVPREAGRDPHVARPDDSPAIGAWRERMGGDEAKAIYKERAATAECVNALARNRGLVLLPVRGLAKVTCVLLLFALAHNLMRSFTLTSGPTGTSPSTTQAVSPFGG
jgi:transposase